MTIPDPSSPSNHPEVPRQPGALAIVLSVLASFFGVQSGRNRERDFQHGNPIHFIAVGIGLTVVLILGIWLAVRVALRAAGV